MQENSTLVLPKTGPDRAQMGLRAKGLLQGLHSITILVFFLIN